MGTEIAVEILAVYNDDGNKCLHSISGVRQTRVRREILREMLDTSRHKELALVLRQT